MASLVQRTRLVFGGLVVAWLLIVAWQGVEHHRVRDTARLALVNRARDISATVDLVLRSQRPFAGVISQDRLESVLNELIRPELLSALAVLNAAGEVVVSAGAPIDFETRGLVPTGEHWGQQAVTLMNLVDLGTNVAAELGTPRPAIVLPRDEIMSQFGTNRSGPGPRPPREAESPPREDPALGPPPPPPGDADISTNRPPRRGGWRGPRVGGEGRFPFGRPFWMTEQEYQSAVEKKGIHSFVTVLSTASMQAATRQDLVLRSIITGLAAVAALGLGVAWRTLMRSSELEVRLVRAAELNTRLKEMNLAAAGLAHETRNPLNIIRGLAQMVSRQADASPEVRKQSREIIDETDRVTAQLNEFINYSRPREVRRGAVALTPVLTELVRALTFDLEEKSVALRILEPLPTIEADEQLLRQALFNLLMNAIQAVERGGNIEVAVQRENGREATLEIRDDGPGVAPEHRSEIFKPYFTTHQKGTGLGLAIVQQIVLAHGWEIGCAPNAPRGAVFRIAHHKPVMA
jgi:signal transduction histidine kinase